ncbi:hypothetical protein RUND412_008719 [Rhizina undulata]
MTSSCIEEVKLDNNFPTRARDITIGCSNDEIFHSLVSLGIAFEDAQSILNCARSAMAKDNHLAVLTFPWTYILSTLWAQSQEGILSYLNDGPQNRPDNLATRLVLHADKIMVAFLISATGPGTTFIKIPPAPFHAPRYAERDKSSSQIIRLADANITLFLAPMKFVRETKPDAVKKRLGQVPKTDSFDSFTVRPRPAITSHTRLRYAYN